MALWVSVPDTQSHDADGGFVFFLQASGGNKPEIALQHLLADIPGEAGGPVGASFVVRNSPGNAPENEPYVGAPRFWDHPSCRAARGTSIRAFAIALAA